MSSASWFRRVLIANRCETARRFIRTCRRLSIETVAIYSDGNVDPLHVRLADGAVRVGPPVVAESSLNVSAIAVAASASDGGGIGMAIVHGPKRLRPAAGRARRVR